MNSRRTISLSQVLLILCAIAVFEATAYAQFTVTVTGTTPGGFPIANGTSSPAPSNPIVVKATVTPLSGITKVIFYRNDVPYFTDTNWPFQIEYYQQDPLGQDNYTYHARAFHSDGTFADSNDYKLTFTTPVTLTIPNIIRMGDSSPVATHPPGRFQDHTQDIKNAIAWLDDHGGGTLFFPCTIPGDDLPFAFTTTTVPADSKIQVADFLGNGHDQIAQYQNGVWNIVDPMGGATYTVNFGNVQCAPLQQCDIPVAGKYLPQLPGKNPCAQVGVWRPNTQEFLVADPIFVSGPATNCGTRSTVSMLWGMYNDDPNLIDVPLTINTPGSLLRRPTVYRRTKGLYDHSLSDGQWWVHDLF